MTDKFAIAVRWPDDPRPYLVHLHKPYFVAEARQSDGAVFFFASLSSSDVPACDRELSKLLQAATEFFRLSLGLEIREAHFIKGNHGHEFPRYLMAKTKRGAVYIVEPDHPTPLVEVKDPAAEAAPPTKKQTPRFDVVTQWRLAEMRKYYQQFLKRQEGAISTPLVVPTLG